MWFSEKKVFSRFDKPTCEIPKLKLYFSVKFDKSVKFIYQTLTCSVGLFPAFQRITALGSTCYQQLIYSS